MAELKYKRILLKLSGEVLLGSQNFGIDPEVADFIASEIKEVSETGAEAVVVFGGGNISRGRDAGDKGYDRITGDRIGMLGIVMNSLALGHALSKIEVPNKVYSAVDMPKICASYSHEKALEDLKEGKVVIIGGGTGSFHFSTDTAAALRACELDCQIVFKATKVDGVYTKDPQKFYDAKKIPQLHYLDLLNKEYKVMDNTALTLCMDNKLPILVFELMKRGNIKKAVTGEKIGTLIL